MFHFQAGAMLGDAFLHQLPHAFGTKLQVSLFFNFRACASHKLLIPKSFKLLQLTRGLMPLSFVFVEDIFCLVFNFACFQMLSQILLKLKF